VTVAVWDDPNDDGDPTDAVLLGMVTTPIAAGSVNTDVLQVIPLTTPVVATGVFFAGATVSTPYGAGQFPAPLDSTLPESGRGWAAGNPGAIDMTTLSANCFLLTNAAAGVPGDWVLRVDCSPCKECTDVDDGSAETGFALAGGGTIGWIVQFGDPGVSRQVSVVHTAIGSTGGPAVFPSGGPITVAVWDDPDEDGDPTNAVLLASTTTTIAAGIPETDMFQAIPLTTPVTVTGKFFAGAVVTHAELQFPAPADISGPGTRSWIVGNAPGTLNLVTLSANSLPPTRNDILIGGYNWLLRIDCLPYSAGTPFCFGAGGTGSTPCPCTNVGAAGNGCPNSASAAGANLAATGLVSLSGDTLQLTGSGMPSKSCFYYQGTSMQSGGAGIVFGDGLRCAGGVPVLLGYRLNMSGASMFPGMMGTPISIAGGVMAPGTRTYQVTYQDTAAFCTPSQFNHTNGVTVFWGL
jgi:hypothetical protein